MASCSNPKPFKNVLFIFPFLSTLFTRLLLVSAYHYTVVS
nr:MAG TPA: hypothetical protein [Caudoviricetes sp.]